MIYMLVAVALVALLLVALVARIRKLEERVARLEGRADPGPYRSAPYLPPEGVSHGSSVDPIVAENDPEVQAAFQAGNMIEAIKRYRTLTGASLKDSKEAVEAMRNRWRLKPPRD
jgi:ribosomal protein L7/L12